jgi:hypothetical protein
MSAFRRVPAPFALQVPLKTLYNRFRHYVRHKWKRLFLSLRLKNKDSMPIKLFLALAILLHLAEVAIGASLA